MPSKNAVEGSDKDSGPSSGRKEDHDWTSGEKAKRGSAHVFREKKSDEDETHSCTSPEALLSPPRRIATLPQTGRLGERRRSAARRDRECLARWDIRWL